VTDIREVIADAVERCRAFAPAPELELPDSEVPVMADAERLSFGITNIIRNAQQAASPTGCVRVSLRTDQDAALLEVADDGPGMSDSFVNYRLFRPFDSTSPEIGMGLGAFQLRDTVRSVGGTVSVKTEVGRGAAFQIRLPLCTSAPRAAPTT
jgi:signal transduction histidine kinase